MGDEDDMEDEEEEEDCGSEEGGGEEEGSGDELDTADDVGSTLEVAEVEDTVDGGTCTDDDDSDIQQAAIRQKGRAQAKLGSIVDCFIT